MYTVCEICSDHHLAASRLFLLLLPRPVHSLRSQAQFLLLDPWQHAHQDNHARGNHSPELDMQNILVEPGLRRRRNRHKTQDQQDIPAHPMVLVDALGIFRATEETGSVILSDTHNGLEEEEDVGDETQDGVRGFEVCAVVGDLVVFDDDEGGDESENGGQIEHGMDVGALLLLLGGVGGLEEEDGLGGEEDAGRVEELRTYSAGKITRGRRRQAYRVSGKKHQRLDKDGSPDCGRKLKREATCQQAERETMGEDFVPYDPDSHLSDDCCS